MSSQSPPSPNRVSPNGGGPAKTGLVMKTTDCCTPHVHPMAAGNFLLILLNSLNTEQQCAMEKPQNVTETAVCAGDIIMMLVISCFVCKG